jgi:AAA domain
MSSAQLPLLVMVGGPPGAGKTTLARRLAEHLDVPWLSRDPFSRGIRLTEGVMPSPERSWDLWYRTLASLLGESVSLVADQTMYKGICEPEITGHLLGRARMRLIHCTSPDAFERFKVRESTQHGPESVEFWRVLDVAVRAEHLVQHPPDLGVDTLVVETSHGYQPDFTTIVQFCLKGLDSPAAPQ